MPIQCTIGYGGQYGFEMYKKWSNVDTFLIQKIHQVIVGACFELAMTHILGRRKSDNVDMGYLGKNMANVQKRFKPASFGADFLFDRKYRPY